MAEYLSTEISSLVDMIKNQEIILPAMQRNFVWPEDKIYHLFDSLMRDYPIGTFLFWDIKADIFNQYAFNQFILDVDDKKGKLQRGDCVSVTHDKYVAVLDGQQRITSIVVGVAGKWVTHVKGKRWDDPTSYFDRYLCIDLLTYPQSDEEEYLFRFVPEADIETIAIDRDGIEHYWVKVSKVFASTTNSDGEVEEFDSADFMDDFSSKYPGKYNDVERKVRRKMLEALQQALCKKKIINYYEAKNKSLAEVIEIFVRVNSGGQKLSASDLMLSVASGTLGNTDIHVKMQDAINSINMSVKDTDNGFKVDKELILTAGLMFTGAKSLSLQKKENYERNQMDAIFQSNWDGIVDALSNTIQYIEYLGFNGSKLSSKNLILPIAYYFFKNNLSDTHKNSTSNRAVCDNIFIRQWMLRAMVNDVFMDGTGSTLMRIRDVIDVYSGKYFPLDELMKAKIKKTLSINDEQIDEILGYEYGDTRIIPLLMDLTCRSTDTYQVDHIWPKSLLLTKKAVRSKFPTANEEQIKAYKAGCNKIANLQLLFPIENQQKNDTPFGDWVKALHSQPGDDYFTTHLIPTNISYDFDSFIQFSEEREKLLRQKIKTAFPDEFTDLVNRFGLQSKI